MLNRISMLEQKLVGDRDPRAHEFTIQFRAFDACKSAAATGVPILLAMSSALVERSLEGGLVIVGGLNLRGSIESIYNAVSIIELAADKGAQKILMPSPPQTTLRSARRPGHQGSRCVLRGCKDALLKALSDRVRASRNAACHRASLVGPARACLRGLVKQIFAQIGVRGACSVMPSMA